MRLGAYDLQPGEYEGYRLIAPISFWMASDEEREEVCGGCGPGKFGDWFVPDTMWGQKITPACDIHDWMYWSGKTLEDKGVSDLFLLLNCLTITQDGGILDLPQSYRCMTYFNAVHQCGKRAFEKGKE